MELKTYFAQDAAGNIISSAIVNVFLQGTTTLATGLTRADGTPLENPFAADGAGRIQFRAPDGYYDVQVSAGPGIIQTLTIQCVDYSEAKADADRAEAAADRADVSAEQAQNTLNSITGINTNFEQNSREQWRRSLADIGLNLVAGSFEQGATATTVRDAVWHIEGGQCYTWGGTLPLTIPSDSTPASTGGISPTTWASVGNQLLRTQLADIDGLKLLGKCPDIATLRTIEPSVDGQTITLERAIAGGPLLNVEFYHDANDSSADDGISTFTTSTGKVWKQVGFDGYNVLIAGYVPSSNNLSSVIQNIIDTIVGKIVSTGRVRGHNRTIIIPADCGITNDFNRHIMTSSVNIPSFFTLKIEGHHVFSFTGNTSGFIIGNDKWPGLTWSVAVAGYNDGHWESGHRVFVCDERVDIVGSSSGLSDDIETYGIYVGNDPVEWGTPDVRDITISDLFITGFKYGQGFGSVSTYSVFFEKLHFEKNGRCIFVSTAQPSNAGETSHYTDCIFSQSEDNHIHHMRAAWNMSFHKCHFGFAKFAVFRLGANVIYSMFNLYDCWVEGFEWLVYQTNRYEGGANQFQFYGGFVYPQSAIGTWPGPRPILFAGVPPSNGVCYSITMFGTKLGYSKKGGYCSVCLGGASNGIDGSFDLYGEGHDFTFTPKGGGDNSSPPFPYSARNTLNGNSTFNGTVGAAFSTDAQSGTFVSITGGATVSYGEKQPLMGNLQSILITAADSTDVVRLISRSRLRLTRGERIAATCSVRPGSASGDIKVSAAIINYQEPALSVSGSTVTSTQTQMGISTLDATTETVSKYQQQAGYPLTASDFVGVYPVVVAQNSTGGQSVTAAIYDYSLPALTFTGFTGTIEVLLPIWWLLD